MAKEKLPPKKNVEKDESDEDEETPTASTTETPFVVLPTKARVPEESRTPPTSPLPRPRTAASEDLPPVPLIPPKIIMADYGAPPRNADDGKKAEVSSLKLLKNVPGKPKESIFETKHRNIYAVDKEYLIELLEAKEKYEKLKKEKDEELLKKMEEKKQQEEKRADKLKCRRLKFGDSFRHCKIRGTCVADSLSEDEHFGPYDPMKHTLKHVKPMKKYARACEKAVLEEMKYATGPIFIDGETFDTGKQVVYDGQKWMTITPQFARIRKYAERTRFSLINFTNQTMEVKLRITGSSNWKIIPVPRFIPPHAAIEVELHYLHVKQAKHPDERLTLYYNVKDAMDEMRAEFGNAKIDLVKYYAGKLTIFVWNSNWQGTYPPTYNAIHPDVRAARKRAKIMAEESKLVDFNKDSSPLPPPSEKAVKNDDDDSNECKPEKQQADQKHAEKPPPPSSPPSAKEKEQQPRQEKMIKKKEIEKKMKKKKTRKTPSQISATQNTSVIIDDASRDVTDDRNVKKYGKK